MLLISVENSVLVIMLGIFGLSGRLQMHTMGLFLLLIINLGIERGARVGWGPLYLLGRHSKSQG
jgi:hypothetical protein